ncbi:MAG: hypothetical protein A07HR60_02866 [uncultured archaeon A07HR60]|nr:MAG: hypothetical protein A07HR60_02866 [uncultured archaeon A07HR60]
MCECMTACMAPEVSQVVDPLVTVRNAVPAEYLSLPF